MASSENKQVVLGGVAGSKKEAYEYIRAERSLLPWNFFLPIQRFAFPSQVQKLTGPKGDYYVWSIKGIKSSRR